MKKNFIFQILGLLLIFNTFQSKAQHLNCGSSAAQEAIYQKHPELRQQQIEFDQYVQNYVNEHYLEANRNMLIIPIVFHVIHDYGVENISDAQIIEQVAILNRDYNLMNADTSLIVDAFKSVKANIGIEFRLAQKDPQGNCTNGIDRIASPLTYLGNDAAKLNPWDRRNYLNVWTVKTMENGVAGYAYKPISVSGQNYHIDGIIILHDYIGASGTSNIDHSRALTHEIGHWLNLSHPWGDNNSPGNACGDDGIPDTPITKGHTDCVPVADFTCEVNSFSNAIYTFNNVTTSSGNIDATSPPSQVINNVTKLQLSNFSSAGVSPNSVADSAFAFSAWDTDPLAFDTVYANLTGAVNTSKYYQFTVTPVLGQAFSLAALTFKVNRGVEGPTTFVVRSSVNNYTTNLPALISPANTMLSTQTNNVFYIKGDFIGNLGGSKVNLAGFANIYKPVTFRIYAYNAESANGYFSIDDVTITGSYGLVENVQNYMDYSYCSTMFTEGQKQAMYAALYNDVSFRNNLWSNENLILTGVLNPTTCAPKADFFAVNKFVCSGTTINFKDNTVNAPATSWSWSFPGGTPSTSTVQNPSVNYPTPGYYPVTLSVSNGLGSNSATKTNYIFVSPNWSDYDASYVESFEDQGLSDRWFKINASNNTKQWQRVTDAGATGSSSLMLSGYYQGEGDVDELISPSYDLRYMTNLSLSFKFIGASKATSVNDMRDSLTVYASTDCGKSWGTPKLILKRANLIKAGQLEAPYKPSAGDAWTTATVNLPAVSYAFANVRFRFRYTSGTLTNNFYIDDINIGGVLNVEEMIGGNEQLQVYPNPFEQEATLTLSVAKPEKVTMVLLDITGRTVASIFKGVQAQETMNYKIEKQNLSSGIYLIKAQVGERQIVKKVMIN